MASAQLRCCPSFSQEKDFRRAICPWLVLELWRSCFTERHFRGRWLRQTVEQSWTALVWFSFLLEHLKNPRNICSTENHTLKSYSASAKKHALLKILLLFYSISSVAELEPGAGTRDAMS
jgi:hypothetical protein